MEAKTKAQELGFLSREYAVGKDKAKWLNLFAEDAVVQDPIGVSPLDPSGEGHKGLEAIEAFYDNIIANGDLIFEIKDSVFTSAEWRRETRRHPNHSFAFF